MKYYLTYSIDARYIGELEADNLEDARLKADKKVLEADFGSAEDIDAELISIEDIDSRFLYER